MAIEEDSRAIRPPLGPPHELTPLPLEWPQASNWDLYF
jgi:hypothetical protein